MELMNEDDPQMLQQQADEAAIKANRGGTPDRPITTGTNRQTKGKQSEKQMISSIKSAADTFFKVSKVIKEKEGLTPEMKKQYHEKLYNKILDKFMTKEEKEMFNRLVNSGPIMIMGGNQMLGGRGPMQMLQGGF